MNETVIATIGAFPISLSVLTTWGMLPLLLLLAWVLGKKLEQGNNAWAVTAETIYTVMEESVKDVVPDLYHEVTPFIATLWVFLVVANLVGLIPGLHSPTSDLSVTAALAVVVFLSVHWFGIRHLGMKAHFRQYISPSPILLPFHLISEVTRTLALAIRLFGNMMSLEMAALLVLLVAGFLVPIPLLMLHIVEALVQAYIFGILALLYIGSGLESSGISKGKSSNINDMENKT